MNLLSSSLFGTGKRPSEMRRLPAVQLFLTGPLQKNSLIKISTAGDLIVSKKIPGTVIFMGCASGVMGASATSLKPIGQAALQNTVDTTAKELMVPGAMVLLRAPQGEFIVS